MKTNRTTVGTLKYFVRYHGLIRGTMFYIMIILFISCIKEKTKMNEEIIQEENKEIINNFSKHLSKKFNNPRLIKRHLSNVHLLINDYLAVDFEVKPSETNSFQIEEFLNWCIAKWIFNTSSELISVLDSIKIFFEYLPTHDNQKEKKEILKICEKKYYYLKRFNSREKLLGGY